MILSLRPRWRAASWLRRRSLIGDGQVVRRGDRLAIVDPLFADWIRRRFPLPA